MSDQDKDRRVRVVTDPVRYRRHQRRKLWKKVSRAAVWVAAVAACMAVIWLVLDLLFRARPE